MEARQFEPINFHFSSVDEIRKEIGQLYKPEYTFERWCAFRDWVVNHETEVHAMVKKLTIKQLKEVVHVFHDYKKDQLVDKVREALLETFDIGGDGFRSVVYDFSVSMEVLRQRERNALIERIHAVTLETYEKVRCERMERSAVQKKALTNPETLDEFSTFIMYRSEGALNAEQLERYDNLKADLRKEARQREEIRQAVVKQVDIGDTDLQIIETVHTKKGHPLWVVQMNDRVEKDVYNALNANAKKLGGYYSSYRGNGAIPGFTFTEERNAKLFASVKDGDVDASQLLLEQQEQRRQDRAEYLNEKGEALVDHGETELNRDRKDNTSRRARMAAAAEAAAEGSIKYGKLMQRVAEGLQDGTIRYLDHVRTISDMDTLHDIIAAAKWRRINSMKVRPDEYDEWNDDIFRFARLPLPSLYKENIMRELENLKNSPGKKLAAARFIKRLNKMKPDQLSFIVGSESALEDYETVFCRRCSVINHYEAAKYRDDLMPWKRAQRMRLTTIHELRAALRELMRLGSGLSLTPEQKQMLKVRELERKFVGQKIDGFFPTPQTLGEEVVAKADIQPGMTVLEPSAGLGHLADIIRDEHPDATLLLCEIYQPLAEALELKGYRVRNDDFFNVSQFGADPDRIVMNPPFENMVDIDHVMHAYKLLKTGGKLVAIMSMAWTYRDGEKPETFRAFVDEHGIWEKNPDGSFISAFRPTGVATCTVVLEK